MSRETVDAALAAIRAGMDVASGLHELLASHPEIVAAASLHGVQLFDVRVPPLNCIPAREFPVLASGCWPLTPIVQSERCTPLWRFKRSFGHAVSRRIFAPPGKPEFSSQVPACRSMRSSLISFRGPWSNCRLAEGMTDGT